MALLASGAVAACAPKEPPQPLMTPVADNRGRYGYSEREIDPARVEISYFAPVRRMPPSATYREPYAQRSVGLAADLALWRAALIAKARNAPRFTVETRRTDVVVDQYRGGYYPDPVFGPPFPYYYRYRGPYLNPWPYYGGWPYYAPYPYYSYDPPRAFGRAVVRMTVYFGTLPGKRSQSADEVLARMTRKYGAANAPPASPTGGGS